MHLDCDEFVVTYDPTQTTPDVLIQTIKESGYAAQVVTGESLVKDQASIRPIPTDLEPLASAIREAREQKKPLLLDFHAAWCAPCKRLETETFVDEQVADLLDQYVVLRIDTDEHVELSEAFGVIGLPDIRLLSFDGQRQEQLRGFQAVDAIIPALQAFLEVTRRMEE